MLVTVGVKPIVNMFDELHLAQLATIQSFTDVDRPETFLGEPPIFLIFSLLLSLLRHLQLLVTLRPSIPALMLVYSYGCCLRVDQNMSRLSSNYCHLHFYLP